MKIITWNINSINARLGILEKVLKKHSPEILMLQETKSQDMNFPEFEIKSWGYNVIFKGQKSYNGVAILVKDSLNIKNDIVELPGINDSENARFIQLEIEDITFVNIYAPNGNPVGTEKFTYKMEWMEALNKHLKSLMEQNRKIVMGGDYNICPTKQDVHDWEANKKDALCHPETIKHYNRLINIGFTDVFRTFHPEPEQYTFWGYRHNGFEANRGWRIDFFLLNPDILESVKNCWVDSEFRGMEKPSDHTPLILEM